MKLQELLRDVTGADASASQRSQHIRLTELLAERHGADSITLKGVQKWFWRKSIPSPWLMRIAALPSPPLNLVDYL